MTRNPKPDKLPTSIDDMDGIARELIIDQYLSRAGVIRRIAQHTGASIDPATGRGHLTHLEMATLYRHHDADEGRNPRNIKQRLPKYALIDRLGDRFDFETGDRQDTLRKSQLVHLLVCLATDDTPSAFTLPSDPDPSNQPDVPALEDAKATGAD